MTHCFTIFTATCSSVLIVLILNFQNKFKKEERENSWRVDKAFRKYCWGNIFKIHLGNIELEAEL